MTTTIERERVGEARQRVRRDVRPGAPLRYVALMAAVLLLLLTGVVLVLTASSVTAIDETGGAFFYFNRHLVFVTLAVIVLLVTLRIDYRFWRRLAVPLIGASIGGLMTVLLVGRSIQGSKRWIETPFANIQPSEFAKFALVVGLATFLDSRRQQLAKSRRIIRPLVVVLAGVCGLLMLQPDLGTTMIVMSITIAMLFAAGVPRRDVAKVSAAVVTLGAVGGLGAGYRRARLLGFWQPVEERLDSGYQTFQSLVGLANGGVGGVGLGEGRAKWGWLPNAHTDFIFAIVGEELGLFGALLVLFLFATVGVLGFRISQSAPDFFGSVLAAGLTVWLVVQVFVNVGGVVGLLPITGVTLPFLSFGGSSLVVNAAAAGVLLNIARQSPPRVRPRG